MWSVKNTYSHYLAKKIVEFAVKNKAKYILIESVPNNPEERAIGTWPFYQLSEKIGYKAKMYGITVESGVAIELDEMEEYRFAKIVASGRE